MINSVEEYLNQLRKELSGSSPATIQNALADSEEYLRMAQDTNPDLQSIIKEYGSPEEIAANYREFEEGVPPGAESFPGERTGKRTARSQIYRIIWIIVGAVMVLISCTLIVAGGGMLWADSALTDNDGYFMSDTIHMTGDSYAIISEPADIELGVSRAFDMGIIANLKGEVANSAPSESIFVGVAREEDLADYLKNVPHERITSLQIEHAKLEYEAIPGDAEPAPPTTQTFWEQSSYGNGTQNLTWEPETGTWVFVIMNEDGSAGVDAKMELGAKVPWLFGAGIGLLIGGVVILALGILVIIFAARRRRARPASPGYQPDGTI